MQYFENQYFVLVSTGGNHCNGNIRYTMPLPITRGSHSLCHDHLMYWCTECPTSDESQPEYSLNLKARTTSYTMPSIVTLHVAPRRVMETKDAAYTLSDGIRSERKMRNVELRIRLQPSCVWYAASDVYIQPCFKQSEVVREINMVHNDQRCAIQGSCTIPIPWLFVTKQCVSTCLSKYCRRNGYEASIRRYKNGYLWGECIYHDEYERVNGINYSGTTTSIVSMWMEKKEWIFRTNGSNLDHGRLHKGTNSICGRMGDTSRLIIPSWALLRYIIRTTQTKQAVHASIRFVRHASSAMDASTSFSAQVR